jgi:hypothetical protein
MAMADESRETLRASALQRVVEAFAERRPPTDLTDSKQLSDVEYEEVMSFDGMRWQEVGFDQVDRCSDAVFWFAPEAFCFYLPGILVASLREDSADPNAYAALVGMLDRSPEPAYWDDFFTPRWTLLSAPELDAVAAWLRWLEAVEPDAFFANTYERARETLRLLKTRLDDERPRGRPR